MSLVPSKSIPQRTRRARVAKVILRSIITRQFVGGDRLVEEELAATIGVSRTPVREALGELAGIGVVHLKPNQGAVVRSFGPAEIRDIFLLRRVLESEAARLAASRIDRAALLHIRAVTQRLLHDPVRDAAWSIQVMSLDQKFHELISSSSGTERLAAEIERYRDLVISLREAVGNTEHALDVALMEHTRVIDALLARNGEEAARAMEAHILRGTDAAVIALCGPAALAGATPGSPSSASGDAGVAPVTAPMRAQTDSGFVH